MATSVAQNHTAFQEEPTGDLDIDTFKLFLHVNAVTCAIAATGLSGNLINMAVFMKQGFMDTINISLFSLALSDTSTLLCLIWASICMLPWHEDLALPIHYLDGWNIGAFQSGAFAYNDCWLAVFISVERCLCIVKPLKVKDIITKKATRIIVCVIFTVCLTYLSPLYFTMYPAETIEPETNKTVVHMVFTDDRAMAEASVYVCQMLLQVGAFVFLVIATLVLIVSLKRKAEWRSQVSSRSSAQPLEGESTSTGMNTRDKRVVKMVVLISCVIIVCVCPGLCLCFVALVEPEFEVRRRYERIHIVCWSFAFLPLAVNSSVNIFIYYNMSSKYRQTLYSIFSKSHSQS